MRQVWLKLVQWICRGFFNFVRVFLLFHYNLRLEKECPFILTNLNPLHPRMVCAKFVWNQYKGFGEEDLLKCHCCIFAISLLSHLVKGEALPLNKLDFLSYKNALCQYSLNLAQWFYRGRYLNVVNEFPLFRYYLPLEKSGALSLNKLEFSIPKNAFCHVWLKLAKRFCWRRTYNNDDDGQQTKVTWVFGSGELKSKSRTQDPCKTTSSYKHWATKR